MLFVCTADRLRSAIALAVTRRRAGELGLPLPVEAAGLLGSDDDPTLEQTERQALRYGTDLSDLRSTAVTVELLESGVERPGRNDDRPSDRGAGRPVQGGPAQDRRPARMGLASVEQGLRSRNGRVLVSLNGSLMRSTVVRNE